MELFILYENASGYVLTHVKEWEQIAQDNPAVQAACADPTRFGQVVAFRGYQPFKGAAEALENLQAIVRGESTELLRSFLEHHLPKKRKNCQIAVADVALGKDLSSYGFPVVADQTNVIELVRGCRFHHKRLIKGQGPTDLQKFHVSLAHAFSRTTIQLDPKRQDKPIQHSIALIDSLDKNINTFAMRLREWYSWHFPELGKIVTDNCKFAEVVQLMGIRDTFTEDRKPELVTLLAGNEELADEIMRAMDVTLGQDLVEADMENIRTFAANVIKLSQMRAGQADYLTGRLADVAPNLQAVVGDLLSARLISHAGSLMSLSKFPASTIQILGAEKALFRALKKKDGKTPKYGLLFQSSFIGRAATKNRGRVSRYLANKCAIASRIDNFSTVPSAVFGEKMRDQVEERLKFLTDRVAPRKNLDVMREALGEYEALVTESDKREKAKKKKEKKSKKFPTSDTEMVVPEETPKKKKKAKIAA